MIEEKPQDKSKSANDSWQSTYAQNNTQANKINHSEVDTRKMSRRTETVSKSNFSGVEKTENTATPDVCFDQTIQEHITFHDKADVPLDQRIEIRIDQGATENTIDFDKTLDCNTPAPEQLQSVPAPQQLQSVPDAFAQTMETNVNEISTPQKTSEIYIIGRYHAIQEIGSGGFGTVYKGFDPNLNREIALKTIRFDKHLTHLIESFEQEARTLAQCNHPNIVQVYDVGRDHQNPYIVMEFVNGPDICEYVEEQRAQKDAKHLQKIICSHMLSIIDAISYLHKNGIYHQDIKPKNILVSLNNNCPKIVDFGLAIENPNSTSDEMSGTYAYMPPEKFEGKVTPKMHDIYALGAVFFEILTGRPAHPGKANTEIIQHVLHNEVTFLPIDHIDEALKNICLRCLKNDPRERYQEVSQIYNDLIQYTGNQTDVNEYPYLLMTIDEKKCVFPLMQQKNFIGRTFSNQVVIPDITISRTQALIEINNDEVTIKNLSEVNKIEVNGINVDYEQHIKLSGHEKIQIANYTFHFVPESEITKYSDVIPGQEQGCDVPATKQPSPLDSKMWEQTISLQENIGASAKQEAVIGDGALQKVQKLDVKDAKKFTDSVQELKKMLLQFEKKMEE
ncbi:FHA domain-containing serine/threonine-protein kinase [Candidatus Uabimicrobium amorphum]|uniref:Serine/threonine protein kinase n=1 Tax=Uabimicrobium amorphum TaxID=2596890 RepID=A0A5S9ITY7_UABAM|nr:FHA domain-containing serine/threonine-protein kinase [Candidatus Uabimicrobium amorphum]BBM86565.1 serine/threonine protein kinase [Candidatus Uabimicrobium amorphum]